MLRRNLFGQRLNIIASKPSVFRYTSAQFSSANGFDIGQSVGSLPTKKTTVILRNLPNTITETKLRKELEKMQSIRKIDLEPGCMLHFNNEASADKVASILNSKLKLQVIIY